MIRTIRFPPWTCKCLPSGACITSTFLAQMTSDLCLNLSSNEELTTLLSPPPNHSAQEMKIWPPQLLPATKTLCPSSTENRLIYSLRTKVPRLNVPAPAPSASINVRCPHKLLRFFWCAAGSDVLRSQL